MSDKHYVGLDLSSYEDNGSKYAISRVTLITADNEYFTAGDDTGLEITAECPYATQAMVDAILAQLKGYKFQGYSAESANLDPAAELGDGITASGIYSVIGKISDDGTGYVDVSAPGEAELDEEYPTIGPQTQEFQRNLQATRKQIEDNNRDLRLAIDNATQYITGNDGGYVVIRMNEDNKPYEILIMDTDDINTAKNVWRWNKSGFGHSNKGYQGPFETAITQDGSIVATYITTGALNAVIVSTGILKSKDGETFYLDLDKGILRMKASSLTISGQTVDEISQSKANSAANSALSSAKSYSDSNLVTAKKYADSAADGAFDDVTQLEVFNRLTGGGSTQGIYLENGKVYINASYIASGTISANKIYGGVLSLGGYGNGNGTITVYDSNGTQIGTIDNNGVNIRGEIISRGTEYMGSVLNGFYTRLSNGKILFQTSDYNSYTPAGEVARIWATDYFNFSALRGNPCGFKFYLNTTSNNYESLSLINESGSTARYTTTKLRLKGRIVVYTDEDTGGIRWEDDQLETNYGIGPKKSTSWSGGVHCAGTYVSRGLYADTLTVSGSKSRDVKTKSYGNRLLYCYETPTPMFADIGEGTTDENGECYVYLDDAFLETIAEKVEYQVFLQKEGPGDIWVSKKEIGYFVVEGTKKIKFSWELKAKQKDYEFERLEKSDRTEDIPSAEFNYEQDYAQEIQNLIFEQEALLNETA